MTHAMQHATRLATDAEAVVVLSGAGMSAESGVPTFRDAQTGLWERFSPEELATESAFRANPSMVWTWYVWRAMLVDSVAPNAGHTVIGAWQQYLTSRGGSLTVATQNVDDLHERAATKDVLHLHGSLRSYRCLDCHSSAQFDPATTGVAADQEFNGDDLVPVVSCQYCDHGILRPEVVWFGEMLPQGAFDAAVEALCRADLVIVVGSSGLVQPAASLPFIGREAGAAIVEINPAATGLSDSADVYVAETAAIALPKILAHVVSSAPKP